MSGSCSLKRRQKISISTLGSSIGPIKLPQVEINALFLSNYPINKTVFGTSGKEDFIAHMPNFYHTKLEEIWMWKIKE